MRGFIAIRQLEARGYSQERGRGECEEQAEDVVALHAVISPKHGGGGCKWPVGWRARPWMRGMWVKRTLEALMMVIYLYMSTPCLGLFFATPPTPAASTGRPSGGHHPGKKEGTVRWMRRWITRAVR